MCLSVKSSCEPFYTYIHRYKHTCILTCIHKHIHTYIHTDVHTFIHKIHLDAYINDINGGLANKLKDVFDAYDDADFRCLQAADARAQGAQLSRPECHQGQLEGVLLSCLEG